MANQGVGVAGFTSERAADCVKRLRRLDACSVSDAFDVLKIAGVVTGIPQRSGSGKIAGQVVTVKIGVADGGAISTRHLGTSAIEMAGPNNIIVVEQRTGIDAGSWGGLLTLGAQLRGVAGVLADGPVRDIDEARASCFPIFTRSLTARTARGRVVEKATNVPIEFEGVTVKPGDYVIADSSGIAFIPGDQIEIVLDAAERIVAKEFAMSKALLEGTPISNVMGGNYEHMLKVEN